MRFESSRSAATVSKGLLRVVVKAAVTLLEPVLAKKDLCFA